MKRGTVVKSMAGRDKDRYQIVLEVKADRILVADGKVRKLMNPKAKNIRHLQKTEQYVDLDQIHSDKALRKALTMLDLI
ncbi:MAG: KOW domain-containing RNA-binding protein [Lachnospiraceae bacterium]|nr:KOW domain-containing RNA-binding protein [Lachnospiraceae bacterium]